MSYLDKFNSFLKEIKINKINKESSKQIGWKPSWFESNKFDDNLSSNIKEFQKKYSLPQTGIVDDAVIRRKIAEKELNIHTIKKLTNSHIVCNNEKYFNSKNNIISFDSVGGLKLPNSCYKTSKNRREITTVVCHWDACLSSKTCYNILKKRKLSAHFLIDNDGTIYQLMDTNDIAWHAGNSKVNNNSIGIEISNAFYTKYQIYYVENFFGQRPVLKNIKVHDIILKEFLGFYPVQINSLVFLISVLKKIYNFSLNVPLKNDRLVTGCFPEAVAGNFNGIISHYHLTKNKIDCAGLDLVDISKRVKDELK